eukprot:15356961-Ditylum_brightwellii.AAC.1
MDKVICLVYVDNHPFFAREDKKIGSHDLKITIENNVASFLGTLVKQDGNKIQLLHKGLINKIIKALGLEGRT